VGIKEEMMDRLQSMVRVPLQKGSDLIMSSIPYSWREQYARRVRKADGVIDLVMPAVTTNDWSLQNCQDYLVEPGGSAGGVPKLAGKESEEHGSRVEAGNYMKLQNKNRPLQAFIGAFRGPGPSPSRSLGFDDPQFSSWLEDLREFWRCWGEYEKLYYPKEQEEVLVELLHSHGLGPELRKVVCQTRSLGTTWTYLEDHLREQRERVDNLLSSTLKVERPISDDKVCHFLDTPEGRSMVSNHVTMDQLDMLPAAETFLWGSRGRNLSPEDVPDVFREFCMDRAEELKSHTAYAIKCDRTPFLCV
jgi:hypothetical protein